MRTIGSALSWWSALFMVAALGAACGRADPASNPLETPVGAIEAPGTPQIVVRLAEAAGHDWLTDIAVTDNDLYVTVAWHGIYRLPKYGGPITAVQEGGGFEYLEIAVDKAAVFWEQSSSGKDDQGPTATLIQKQTLDDGGAVSTFKATDLLPIAGSQHTLQTDGALVYVTLAPARSSLFTIHRFVANGGAPLTSILPFDLSPGTWTQQTEDWIARDGSVYYTRCTDAGDQCSVRQIEGTDDRELAVIPGDPDWLGPSALVKTADESAIYLVGISQLARVSAIWKVDRASGIATELCSPVGGATLMVVDEREVFFVSASSMVQAVSKEGGTPRLVADLTQAGTDGSFNSTVFRLAQDETRLFAMVNQERVLVIPKRPAATP